MKTGRAGRILCAGLLVLGGTAAVLWACSDTGGIHGTVTESLHGHVLCGSFMGLTRTADPSYAASTNTDVNGDYKFTGLTPDGYAVSAGHMAYQPKTANVTVTAGGDVGKDFVLDPVAANIKADVVSLDQSSGGKTGGWRSVQVKITYQMMCHGPMRLVVWAWGGSPAKPYVIHDSSGTGGYDYSCWLDSTVTPNPASSGYDTVATLRFPWNTAWVPNGSYTIKAALKCSDPHKDGVDENPDPVAESWVHWAGSPPTATADGVAGGTTVSISVVNVVITNYRAKDTPLDSHDQDAFKYDPDAASPLCNPSFEVAIDNWTSEPMRIRVWMQATAWGDTRPVPECDPFTALDVSAAGTYTLTWNGSNPGAPPGWKGEWGTWSFDVDVYRMDPTGTWATDHFYAKTHDGWSENYDVLVDPLHHDVWWYCDQTATPPGYQFRCNYTVHSDESTQPTAVDLVTLKELTVKATQTGPVTLNTLHDNITSYPGSGNTNEDDTLGTWRTVFTGQTASGAEHRRDGTDPRILATNQAKSIIPVVESPHGDPTDLTGSAYPPCTDYAMPHQHAHNVGIWRATGLEVDHFSAKPTLAFNWQISGYVGRPNTTVTWYWHDPSGPGQTQGLGSNPVLYVDYFDPDPSDPYTDYYPPDNTWFGDRMVTVSIGGLTFVRPLRVFFKASGGVYRRQSDDPEKCVATWFYYWRLGAVPELLTRGFHYDQSLVCQAQHGWSGTGGDTFTIGPSAHAGTGKPIFDVTTGNYHEAMYPDGQGEGIHGVAKLCRHEYWHSVLRREVRATLYGGMGHADQDHDGLSDTREAEIGTNPLLADTCLIASYCAEYAEYAPEGDQELFCRWKQDGVLGDETKDWSHTGKQSIFLNASP